MEGRSASTDWLIQMSANLVGTVLAAGVIYLVGVVAGVITPDTAIIVISALTSVAGFIALAILKRQTKELGREVDARRIEALRRLQDRRDPSGGDPGRGSQRVAAACHGSGAGRAPIARRRDASRAGPRARTGPFACVRGGGRLRAVDRRLPLRGAAELRRGLTRPSPAVPL
jgi:hypothetical protein